MRKFITLCYFVISSSCFAQSNDFGNAISNTQNVLTDSKLRTSAINSNEKAKQVDSSINSLVGGDKGTQDEMYLISSDILNSIAGKSDDPTQLGEILIKAQKDPEAFFNSLSDAQKKKISDISKRIPSNKN